LHCALGCELPQALAALQLRDHNTQYIERTINVYTIATAVYELIPRYVHLRAKERSDIIVI
jgi:hypothetical protein